MKEYNILKTDWGYVVAVWSDRGLWELTFPYPEVDKAVAHLVTKDAVEGSQNAATAELAKELRCYYTGYQVEFGVPLDWTGYTAFQSSVLRYTTQIPYGETMSYGEVAAAVGSPKASRAVGGALHINRTPVIVPCHRVVGANKSLVGFGGGLELKQALLLLEQGAKQV